MPSIRFCIFPLLILKWRIIFKIVLEKLVIYFFYLVLIAKIKVE